MNMRIFAVADLHGKADRIEYMVRVIDHHHPTLVIIAGDITSWRHCRESIQRLNELSVPTLAVTGNGDGAKAIDLIESATNIVHLHLKRRRIKGISFCGAGGTIPIPFYSRLAWKESELLRALGNFLRQEDILVTHCPPYGVLDRVLGRVHSGSKRLRLLIENVGPRMVLCGHIHEDPGKAYLGDTLVINCNAAGRNGGALIDLVNDQSVIKVRMLKR